MKIRNRIVSFLLVFLLLVSVTTGCSPRRNVERLSLNSAAELSECKTPLKASLVMVTPTVDVITVDTDLIWVVRASGCTGVYALQGAPSSSLFRFYKIYTRRYSTGNHIEQVQVVALNRLGNTVASFLVQWEIIVVNPVSSTGSIAPTANLKANDVDGETTVAHGAKAVLTWTSDHTSSCSLITNTGTHSVATMNLAGVDTEAITGTTTFTLYCSGDGGQISDTVTINPRASESAPEVTLLVNGSSHPPAIAHNSTVTLSWTSSNASSCKLNSGDDVEVAGHQVTPPLTQDKTFKIFCQRTSGVWVSDEVVVSVNPPIADPTVTLLANGSDNPDAISYNSTITLSWTSTDTSSCLLNPGDVAELEGNTTSPMLRADTTYNIECVGVNGQVVADTVVVPVNGPVCDWPVREGFYKDLLVDGGASLSGITPTAADYLGLSTSSLITRSSSYQKGLLVKSTTDLNGILLFPDNAPRYRMVYVNGGNSDNHGSSLGSPGRSRFKTFFENGGSYTGSCAGALLVRSFRLMFGLWPRSFGMSGTSRGRHSAIFDESDHPFVKILEEIGGTTIIDNIAHRGGPYFKPRDTDPAGTEYIGTIKNIRGRLYNSPYLLAYKPGEDSGRMVVQPSHPEYEDSGEQQDLMAAIFRYALDGGRQVPWLKGELQNNTLVTMDEDTTKVGDQQYHRWSLEVPAGATSLEIDVTQISEDVDLYVSHECPSHRENYGYRSANPDDSDESITITNPPAGTGHISVYGNHDVKNGSAYDLRANWN